MDKMTGRLPSPGIRALIAYGTRYGATAGTSEEIARILRGEGFDVKVVDLKEEKVRDISGYDLVVVGSGIPMGMWAREADDFLKRFHKDLAQKKHAIFASTMKTMAEREGKIEQVARTRKIALEDKATKYNLHPISQGFFGGVIDYNKMSFLTKATMNLVKPQLEQDGFKEAQPGVYDLRDWDEIRDWAKELAARSRLAGE